ncbi:MAG TPA: CGNR zinc finger domain-containing protein [Ktedonobacteraceae bacterium]|nr:CGNR zinc finger domain-containing protein [Ktedonobacteraceae bacterium]
MKNTKPIPVGLCTAKRIMDSIYLDFINSEFRDFRGRWVRDDLQQPRWLEQFLIKWGLQVDRPLDASTLTTLIELRTLLRSMIEALVKGQLTGHDLAALNTVLLKMPLNRQLLKDSEGYQLAIVPLKKDWDWVQAEVVASFAHLLAYHDPRRLKVCVNSNCRWVFYDESKSRTRLYCSPDKCANLLKVRRFRARHKNNL